MSGSNYWKVRGTFLRAIDYQCGPTMHCWLEYTAFTPHIFTKAKAKLDQVNSAYFLDALASLKTMFKIHSVSDVFKISRLQSIREY